MDKFNIKDKRFPKWDNIELNHKHIAMLDAINVTLLQSTSLEDVRAIAPNWLLATWDKEPSRTIHWKNGQVEGLDEITVDRLIYRGFQKKFLPTFLNTIRFTFLVEGLNAHDFTHVLRNRAFNQVASSDCTGDRDNSYRDIGIPEFLLDMGDEYLAKYLKATDTLMEVYRDSMNSKEVSHLDARLLLPRTATQFIQVNMSLGELMGFVSQRIDRQIQPASDNIIAMKLLLAAAKVFPFITTLVKPDAPNKFYINESQSNFGSHYFKPNENNDVFDYNDEHFLFNQKRDKLAGQKYFSRHWDMLIKEYDKAVATSYLLFPYLYDEEYLTDWK